MLNTDGKQTIKDPINTFPRREEEPVEGLVEIHASDEKQLESNTPDCDVSRPPLEVTPPPEEKQEGRAEEFLQVFLDPKECYNEQIATLEPPSDVAEEINKDANQPQSMEANTEVEPSPDEETSVAVDSKDKVAYDIAPENESIPNVDKVSSAYVTVSDAHFLSNSVPEKQMEQFKAQLQRLQESFELERQEIQEQSKRDFAAALAAKDIEIAQAQELLKEKDKKVRELLRIKEGNELRMDSLKREVVGIKALLEEK